MTQICPKCQYSRRSTDTAPAWQCPSCGVAYSKASEAARGPAVVAAPWSPSRRSEDGVPWGKGLALAVLVAGAWFGWKGVSERMSVLSGPGAEEIASLASGVKPDEIVMYSTASCGYCHQAAAWLTQNGFQFTTCDLDRSAACLSAFRSYGATGTPYLVVRGHHMKEGFDGHEFLAALKS